MFEGIVATILNRYLSEYIDEVDYNNLKLGIFSGTLELLNVKIKPSALYQFDLPVEVKCGKIGKLKINVSWKNILTKPAVAIIEDLLVVLGPFEEKINDAARIEEMIMTYKRKLLQEVEKIDKNQIFDNKEKGFADRLQDTIINNIQIYIKNVHIRYEDKHSIKKKNISCGLYLKEFRAETVDKDGNPNFLNADEKIIFKVGVLNGFNLYWNSLDPVDSLLVTNADLRVPANKEASLTKLKESIETGKLLNCSFVTLLEKNLNLDTHLTLRRSYLKEDLALPKITFKSSVSAINFQFHRHQYKSILEIVDYYTLVGVHKNYVKFRPTKELSTFKLLDENSAERKKLIKSWWIYAFTSIAETQWRSYRKERILDHWSSYKEYIKKYELSLKAEKAQQQLSEKDLKYIQLLEKKLNLDSILDARAFVREKFMPAKNESQVVQAEETVSQGIGNRDPNYVEFRMILNFPVVGLKLKITGYDIMSLTFKHISTRFEIKPNRNSKYFLLNTQSIQVDGIYYNGENIKESTQTEMVTVVKSATAAASTPSTPASRSGEFDYDDSAPVTMLASETAKNMLFRFCLETNPNKIENAELSVRAYVSSLEIYYEKTVIQEILRFFKTELIDFEEVKKIRDVWSKAGLIYAVENHKQIHINAELESPYFIIPVTGTNKTVAPKNPEVVYRRQQQTFGEENSIIFYLGKTTIQSELQPKLTNYTPSDIHDLEKNFYDKFKLNVNDVQVILVPNGLDWKNYLNQSKLQSNYEYHLLKPVSTTNTVFLSINPSYKKLPKLKLDASCTSIIVNFSDSKILKLFHFIKYFPLPTVPKTQVNLNSSFTTDKGFSTPLPPVSMNQAGKSPSEGAKSAHRPNQKQESGSAFPAGSKLAEIVEPDDEWEGPFRLPTQINGDPIPNYSQVLCHFEIKDFSIDLNSTKPREKEKKTKSPNALDVVNEEPEDEADDNPTSAYREYEYLKFLFYTIKIDFSINKYGMSFKAGLDDLKLIDKLHTNVVRPIGKGATSSRLSEGEGEPIEILSSFSYPKPTAFQNLATPPVNKELIRFYFRQTEKDAPNFKTLYSNILMNLLFECRNIQLVCHRTAIVYFLNFSKNLADQIALINERPGSKGDGQTEIEIKPSELASKRKSRIQPANTPLGPPEVVKSADTSQICELNVIARMKNLTWKMFDSNIDFGNMTVSGLSLNYNLWNVKTEFRMQLKTITINYTGSEKRGSTKLKDLPSTNSFNALVDANADKNKVSFKDIYKKIISCTADGGAKQFFDFHLVLNNSPPNQGAEPEALPDSINLNVGKIKIICLVKFVNELLDFIDPIVNPLPNTLTEQMKGQAKEAMNLVKSAYYSTIEESGDEMPIVQQDKRVSRNLTDDMDTSSVAESGGARQIQLNIHVTSPQVIIPQNSKSLSAFLVNLGNLHIKNEFYEEVAEFVGSYDAQLTPKTIKSGGHVAKIDSIDDIEIRLENVQVKRIKFKLVTFDHEFAEQSNEVDYDERFYVFREDVVEPINFNARLKRVVARSVKALNNATAKNLKATNIARPDIEVIAQLTNLNCILSLRSAKLIFAILEENLAEGTTPASPKKPEGPTSSTREPAKKPGDFDKFSKADDLSVSLRVPNEDIGKRTTEDNSNNTFIDRTSQAKKPNPVNIKICLGLNEIKLVIVELRVPVTSPGTALDTTNQTIQPSRVDFCLLEINEIAVNYFKYLNGSWLADVKMRALKVNDLRPDSNLAVKEMMVPINKDMYFFELNYSFEAALTKSIMVFKLDHLRVNLCLPYILQLYQIAMDAISSPKSEEKRPSADGGDTLHNIEKSVSRAASTATSALSTTTRIKSSIQSSKPLTAVSKTRSRMSKMIGSDHEHESLSGVESGSMLNEPAPVQSNLEVTGQVKLPEVVLFAEPEKSNSKILVLNVDLNLKYISENEETDLRIDMNELSIRLGEFSNYKRKGIPFLHPCTATITMKQNNHQKKIAYYLTEIKSLYFNMTPRLYEVVMGVINTLNKSGTEAKQKETETKKLLEDAEPFVKHKTDKETYINKKKHTEDFELDDEALQEELKAEAAEEAEEKEDEEKAEATSTQEATNDRSVLEALDLTIGEAYITFCEETEIELQPLTILRMQLNGRVCNWTKNIHLKADLMLEASYYNDRLSNWEPLIENVMQYEDYYRPWLLNIWVAMEPGSILQPPESVGRKRSSRNKEPLSFPIEDLDYSVLDAMYNVKGSSHVSTGHREAHAVSKRGSNSSSYVLIESNDSLNLNVTPSAYKVIMYLSQMVSKSSDTAEVENLSGQVLPQKSSNILESKMKMPLKFLNFLGEESDLIVFDDNYFKPEYAAQFNLKKISQDSHASNATLQVDLTNQESQHQQVHKERIKKLIGDSQRAQIDLIYDEKYKFFIRIHKFEQCSLSMKTDGSYLFPLSESPESNGGSNSSSKTELDKLKSSENKQLIRYNMMYKVKTLYGRTKIIFSSPLQIENNLELRLFVMIELTETVEAMKDKFNFEYRIEITRGQTTRKFGVLFDLWPGKIYYVPLYIAYNCKIYVTPNFRKYFPAQVFDIRGYNIRIDEISEYDCPRLSKSDEVQVLPLKGQLDVSINVEDESREVQSEQEYESFNDFQIIRQLSSNVKSYKHALLAMHANFRVLLYAPFSIKNSLPFKVRIDIENTKAETEIRESSDSKLLSYEINSGENLLIHSNRSKLEQSQLHVINYLNINWVGTLDWSYLLQLIDKATKQAKKNGSSGDWKSNLSFIEKLEMNVSPTAEMHVSGKHLAIFMAYKHPNEFTLYSPYWLVNKSGMPLKVRSCDTNKVFDVQDDSILLFDFKKNNDKNNRVKMSIVKDMHNFPSGNDYEMSSSSNKWSTPFSLDAAGTTGMVECKSDDNKTFNFLMRTTMSNSSRTKLITFAPVLYIVNQLDESILMSEIYRNKKSDCDWKLIEPISKSSKPLAFWTRYSIESKQVCFRIKTLNEELITQPFPLENPGRFVLIAKPANQSDRAISITEDGSTNQTEKKLYTVLISGGSKNPVTIIIRKYQYGDAVSKFVNLCENLNVGFKQKNSDFSWDLEAGRSMYFVWPELINTTPELFFTVFDSKEPATAGKKDADAKVVIDPNSIRIYKQLNLINSGTYEYSFMLKEPEMPKPASSNKNNESSTDDSEKINLLNRTTSSTSTESLNPPAKPTGPQEPAKKVNKKIICVSYLDGVQRVILFTTDQSLAEIERNKESSTMEIFINLKGIQISVINNVNLEIATLSIGDSQAVWSVVNSSGESKIFTNEYGAFLEKLYANHLFKSKQNFITTDSKKTKRRKSVLRKIEDTKFDINFKEMIISHPDVGQLIRRWQPGMSLVYRTSATMMSLNCKIHKLQIDNQLPDAYFPICFYKAPNNLNTQVPFVELRLFTEQQEVLQIYRHFECNVQEFYLKMDKGFIYSIKDWYDAATASSVKSEEQFDLSENDSNERSFLLLLVDEDKDLIEKLTLDFKMIKEIMEYTNQSGNVKQSAHIQFDFFALSPILFNLSFSVNGTAHTDDKEVPASKADTIFNFFLESIGSTITEFKDVRFRFKQLQIENEQRTWDELYNCLFDHYKIQVLHQAYILILGLDVLGNPFGLVSDFSQGLTDLFYEPLIGYLSKSAENDEENKELTKTSRLENNINMGSKIKTTLNKTISSAAGSGSLITGSLARVLATCTFDQEYKRKRQYNLSKSSNYSFPDTLRVAGKGVVSGVIYGITGIVRSPVEERKNGVKGVVKGVGKGFVGLFAKPMSSVFDGISQSLDGLKRFAQSGSETIANIRLPRHLINDVAILPYSEYQARGYEILRDLQNDNIALNESYWAHVFYPEKKSIHLLYITDCSIYKLKKNHAQILRRWHVIGAAIPLSKIVETKIITQGSKDQSQPGPSNAGNLIANAATRSTSAEPSAGPKSKQKINRRKKTGYPNAEEDYETFELYVIIKESSFNKPSLLTNALSDGNQNNQTEEKLLLIHDDKETVHWIESKINSAIKYIRELRTKIDF